MSKKKNTLKDLDQFLKQQAATLVAPETLKEKKDLMLTAVITEPAADPFTEDPSADKILADLQAIAKAEGEKFPAKFYDLIIKTLEVRTKVTPEDQMLINTALYLKSGPQWKEVIRSYWRNRKP
ncbi:MAG TPA: hypothetical protein VEB86_18510 [Chryseosolibacter sp.]|nr:hypothetical protein [Chryseosolibacter sp.]